jgi:EAL domain-containing protein (putative c-di-GMP-specific phosphodiesterase class I)
MQLSANRQLRLLQDLRKAIARDELILHYQPKFPAAGAPATGAEALLRWQHPSWACWRRTCSFPSPSAAA